MGFGAWWRERSFKRATYDHAEALLFPAPRRLVVGTLRQGIDRLFPSARDTGWTPATLAAVVVTFHMRDHIFEHATVGDRARALEALQTTQRDDLLGEFEWLRKVQTKQISVSAMPPLVFRIRLISSLLARWLVKDKTIDLFTKSAFSTTMAMALAEYSNEEIHAKTTELMLQIGSLPAEPPAG